MASSGDQQEGETDRYDDIRLDTRPDVGPRARADRTAITERVPPYRDSQMRTAPPHQVDLGSRSVLLRCRLAVINREGERK